MSNGDRRSQSEISATLLREVGEVGKKVEAIQATLVEDRSRLDAIQQVQRELVETIQKHEISLAVHQVEHAVISERFNRSNQKAAETSGRVWGVVRIVLVAVIAGGLGNLGTGVLLSLLTALF